jgi:alanine-glyoxylate transaminase / serine-glyoxylate transaminase / serine-pyruvate transaminase
MKNRSLLMIPGPVEFEPAVLSALGAPTTGHLAPDFIDTFGQALERLRQVFLSEDGQPFVLAGSGTLAMDSAAANLVEPGDSALVINTGYFGDRMGAILERYGAEVTHLRAEPGGCPELEAVEDALSETDFKLMAITHVDTSTGVLTPVQELAALGQKYGVLVVVDGVCSAAGEELRMSEWGIDLAFTASQKAVGVPPGLALLVAGPGAMAVFRGRKAPVYSYYADWTNWLPVMEAYEARKTAYFGTPPVNLIFSLNTSLGQILAEGMDARTARHMRLGNACKAAMAALGLGQVPLSAEIAAHTMTAPRFPQGISGPELIAGINRAGVVVAGGLHPQIRGEYFRIGHMGAVKENDILATVGAVEAALAASGYRFEAGSGVGAAVRELL